MNPLLLVARRAVLLAALAAPVFFALHDPAWSQSRSERIRERLKTRPGDPTLYYFLATAEIAEGDTATALAVLDTLASIGNGFLPVRDIGFDPVWNHAGFQRARARLEAKLPKVTAARELFRLDNQLIPEGIAWDPESGSYYVGSIAARKIVRIDAKGVVSDFSKPEELKNVLGLAIDAQRRRLHAVSTNLVGRPDSTTNRVVSYDLATGAVVRSVPVPAAAQLNDVAVGPNGDLYATDSRAGGVFRIRGESGAVDTLAALGSLPGVNGIAVAADGSALYLAHSTGVARFELASGALLLPRIEIPAGETIAAIDGLYADGSTLIGIQNVTNPGRVVRVHLRADGRGADRIETLLSHHHPAIDEPTTGAVVGRSFALLATTQVARYKPDGTIESPETLKKPVVLMVPLEAKRN